jgi:CRP-like cAMP-binding protein
LLILAVLLGSLVVPLLLATVGLDGAIWTAGLVIPVLCLAGIPRLRRMDAEAVARRAALAPKTALLQGCDLFTSVGEGAVEQLAGESTFVDVPADAVVVRQDETADAFYVIDSGIFAVTARTERGTEEEVRDMGPGEYFGEIGLIEAIPRTATVRTRGPGRVLRVGGEAFVDALTHEAPSAALLDGASVRLGRTHPSRTLTKAALGGDPA